MYMRSQKLYKEAALLSLIGFVGTVWAVYTNQDSTNAIAVIIGALILYAAGSIVESLEGIK